MLSVELTKQTKRKNVHRLWYHDMSVSDVRHSFSSPKILEIGCGEGLLMDALSDLQPVAIDLAFPRLEVIARTLHSCSEADAQLLPFRSEVFESVVCHHTIEHVPSPYSMLLEICRVLKPQGIVCITTPIASAGGRIFARSRNARGERVLSSDHTHEFKSSPELITMLQLGNKFNLVKMERRWETKAISVRNHLFHIPLWLYYSDYYVVMKKA